MLRFLASLLPLMLTAVAMADTRVGVLAYRGSERTIESWNATVEYLDHTLAPEKFELVPLDLPGMRKALASDELDFVLTNPGHYAELEVDFGVARIATLESAISNDPHQSIGSAIVVRRERNDLQTLADLKGGSILAVDPIAFGGFNVALQALSEAGLDRERDISVRFSGFPMDRIAHAVAAGEADAGILRACLLEQMVAEGRIAPGSLRVLAPRDHFGFRCAASTALYPDWPFAKTRHTRPALAKKVAQALYAMPPGHPAALAGGYRGWTIPVDYQAVHELLRELHVPPYGRDREFTMADLARRYWRWFAGLLLAAVLVVWHGVRVERQVRLRTAQLSLTNERLKAAMQEQASAEEKVRRHQAELAHAARVNTVGELAASMAHEINQPLAAIGNYTEGCLVRLRGKAATSEVLDALREIGTQAARAGAIVHRLRSFLRKESPKPVPVDVNEAVLEAVSLFMPEARRHRVAVRTELASDLPQVSGELIQLEQVVLNLLRNALEAMEEANGDRREIILKTARDGSVLRVTVSDTGPGLSEEARRHLFEPFFTTKARGMGLGLSTSRSIVEAHGGRLMLTKASGGGALAMMSLPVMAEKR